MNICPTCNAEFLDHVSLCSTCHEKLIKTVDRSPLDPANNTLASKEDLLKEETAVFAEGSLDHCREFEKILHRAQIPALVYPAKLGCDDNAATLGSSCGVKYLVLVRPGDLERCARAVDGQFFAQVAREGQGNLNRGVVDLEQSEVTCPACNERGPLKEGECSFCGLFLGEHNS
jgi:hypothetical protein